MKRISILSGIKKALIIPSFAALALGMTACSDWLDMPSYTDSDTETVFANEATADMYVQGCYRGLIHTEMFYHLGSGDGVTHPYEDAGTNNSKYNIGNFFYNTTSPFTVTTIFKEQYRIIEATNIAISRLNNMPETEKRNSLLGEALAIRAFCYHNLIRIYGDVPAVWLPLEEMDPNDENTFYPKRSPRDEIYDQIIGDLQTAVEYIPWYSESGYSTYERLTKQGTYALLARIALHAGGYSLRWDLETNSAASMKMARRDDATRVRELYQIASDACAAVISKNENGLVQASGSMSGFQHLWYNFCQRNFSETQPEILWELAQYGANTNSAFGVYAHPGSRGGTFGSRKAMQGILPTYYLSFDEKDTRRDVSCTAYSIYFLEGGAAGDTWVDVGTAYSSIMPGKFRISWCVEPQAAAQRNLNIPVLRYSDLLLLYAEAQNFLNNGPSQAAKDALQTVRTRAGIGSMEIPSDQDGFEAAIVQERKWEFASELHLRTDLIRMNRMAKEVAATQQALKNLSDRTGAYANTPTHRLYKYHVDAQTYGDKFLAIEYIDLTDAAEIAEMEKVPTDAAEFAAYQEKLAVIVKAHGVTMGDNDKWYPVKMFEAYTSTFNGNARKAVGFGKGFNALQIGAVIYNKPTGSAENGGVYPNWIAAPDGSDGVYYGFVENKVELLPFAASASGHPMVDNPNLTQHPGYQ